MLESSKLKAFADDNFKSDESGRRFSKQVENTVGKGEISRNEQFFFFSNSVFKRLVLQTHENQGLFGKGLIIVYEPLSCSIWFVYDYTKRLQVIVE